MVVAADYLSIDAAQKAVFPEPTTFEEVFVTQSPEQLQSVLARAGQQPPARHDPNLEGDARWHAAGPRLRR